MLPVNISFYHQPNEKEGVYLLLPHKRNSSLLSNWNVKWMRVWVVV